MSPKIEDELVSPVSPASVIFPVNEPAVSSHVNNIDSVRDGGRPRFQESAQMPRSSEVAGSHDFRLASSSSFVNGKHQNKNQNQFQYSSPVDRTMKAQHSESSAPPIFITTKYQQQQQQSQYQQPAAAWGDDKPPNSRITRSDSTASTLRPTEPPSKWAYMSQDGWFFETVSLVFSFLCVVGIVVILFLIQGRRVDDWAVVLTPNTLVSLLSTLSKAALLLPVANCIGQLKWLHFEGRPRKLMDLEILDGATRGPAGAFSMLLHGSTRSSVAVLGAMVTILALVADPFSQQAINIGRQEVAAPNGIALFASATVYNSGASVNGQQSTGNADASMYGAILNGIFTGSSANMGFDCSTSKCSWPDTYSFLGVRSTCNNVTHLITEQCGTPGGGGDLDCTYQTPGNLTISTKTFAEQGTTRSTVLNSVSSTELNSRDAELARYAVWRRPNGRNSPWEVTECTLALAAYYYGKISAVDNKLRVGASAVFPLRGPPGPDFNSSQPLWTFKPNMTEPLANEQIVDYGDSETVVPGSKDWRQNLQPVTMIIGLADLLEARDILGREVFTANLEAPVPTDTVDTGARGVARTVLATADTTIVSRQIARSMTDRLRQGGTRAASSTTQGGGSPGVAIEIASFYTIAWGWFSYLPLLFLGAMLLLLITVYQVSRYEARERKAVGAKASVDMPRYKSSALALLLGNVNGFEGSSRVEAAKGSRAGLKSLAEKEWVLKWRDGFVRAGVPET